MTDQPGWGSAPPPEPEDAPPASSSSPFSDVPAWARPASPEPQPEPAQPPGYPPPGSVGPPVAYPPPAYPPPAGTGPSPAYPPPAGTGPSPAYPPPGGGYGPAPAYPPAGGGYGPAPAYPPAGGGYGAPPGGYGPPPPTYGAPPGGYGNAYGYNAGWGGEYKPGVIPLRPLGLGEILDGAFSTIRLNPVATLGTSALVSTASALLNLLVEVATRNSTDRAGPEIVVYLLNSVTAFLLTAGLIVVVSEAVLGRRSRLENIWARIRSRVWTIIGVSLFVTIVSTIGLVFLVAPGVWLWVLWSLAVPAVALEGAGLRDSLGRSRTLIRNAWWRTFGIVALAELIVIVIALVISLPFSALLHGGSDSFAGLQASAGDSVGTLVALAVASLIVQTISRPLLAGVIALVYVDRRIRVEGLDVTLAQAARGEQGTSQSGLGR